MNIKKSTRTLFAGAFLVLLISVFLCEDGGAGGPALGVILLILTAGWASEARGSGAWVTSDWWAEAWKRFGKATAPFGEKLADLGDWLIEEEEK